MDFEHLALVGIVRQLRHDMSFIVGIIVIAVDNSDGIIQLQAVLKALSASGKQAQHPVLVHPRTDSGRDFNRLARL